MKEANLKGCILRDSNIWHSAEAKTMETVKILVVTRDLRGEKMNRQSTGDLGQ